VEDQKRQKNHNFFNDFHLFEGLEICLVIMIVFINNLFSIILKGIFILLKIEIEMISEEKTKKNRCNEM